MARRPTIRTCYRCNARLRGAECTDPQCQADLARVRADLPAADDPSLFSRFGVPIPVEKLLHVAAEHRVIDLKEIYALAIRHGVNWRAMADEVCAMAFNGRHSEAGTVAHAAVVTAAEKVWAWIEKAQVAA